MLNRDFKEFVECLTANAVEYLIVGGYAHPTPWSSWVSLLCASIC